MLNLTRVKAENLLDRFSLTPYSSAPLPPRVKAAKQYGEVSEWLKEHAWKVCIRQRIEGSNPSLTATFEKELVRKYGLFFRISHATGRDENAFTTPVKKEPALSYGLFCVSLTYCTTSRQRRCLTRVHILFIFTFFNPMIGIFNPKPNRIKLRIDTLRLLRFIIFKTGKCFFM